MRESGHHAPSFRRELRPRYLRRVSLSQAQVASRLSEALRSPTAACEGSVVRDIISLSVRRRERHVWSPKLDVRMSDDGEQTLLAGRYGPMPSIWTFVVFCYALSVSAGIVCAVYAYAVRFTGGHTLAGWGVLGAAGVIFAIYGASYAGQRLGHKQMDLIHHFVDDVLRIDTSETSQGPT